MAYKGQSKHLWAQFALPSITLSGVGQAPNQSSGFPLYGPSPVVVRASVIMVHCTSRRYGRMSFYRVSLLFGGIRTLGFRFVSIYNVTENNGNFVQVERLAVEKIKSHLAVYGLDGVTANIVGCSFSHRTAGKGSSLVFSRGHFRKLRSQSGGLRGVGGKPYKRKHVLGAHYLELQ